MDSVTKTKLAHEQIVDMARVAFGAVSEVNSISELTDGYFNAAYRIDLQDGQSTVLKVAPRHDVQVLRYEHNLMEIEASVLQQVGSLNGMPVPKLLFYGQAANQLENEFIFMEFIPGDPLNKQKDNLAEKQRQRISNDLGVFAKQLAGIQGQRFGHVSQAEKQFDTWPDAFLFMIQELLDDAADAQVSLPLDYTTIYQLVMVNREVLAQIESPSLVHKDLWQGNIFVDPETAVITGIVDFERAIYGDVLMEAVCGFLLEDDIFMQTAFGKVTLTKEEQIRVTLYQIYLFLIMVIECSYRHYDDNRQELWARMQLQNSFETLAKLTGSG